MILLGGSVVRGSPESLQSDGRDGSVYPALLPCEAHGAQKVERLDLSTLEKGCQKAESKYEG